MESAKAPPGPSDRFDDILAKLRAIVERLEGGNLSLEDSLRSFEEGMDLCRRGAGILDAAEKKVELLLAGPAAGPARTAPFDPGARSANQPGPADHPDDGDE